jgi:TRAP-type mannitol/chloroaromatic compound transport system permease small subunit
MPEAAWYETGLIGAIVGLVVGLVQGIWHLVYSVLNPGLWLSWLGGIETVEQKQSLMRFVYFGASAEFFFAVLAVLLALTAVGIWRNAFLWGCVRVLEGTANGIGRVAAWAGLLMVLQQIIIVFLQRIFRVAEISIGPFGIEFAQDLSWYAEGLKFYNALVVALCVSWTFVQGGHVRVDLVYSAISHRAQRVMDMVGSVIFMMPVALVVWLYGWFFMWRHLIVPNPSATNTLDQLLTRAQALRWNVETTGFSPNGFSAYFLFKVLLVLFAGLVFLQAWALLWRSYLEFVEGEDSAGRYLDRDSLGAEPAERPREIG